MARCLSRPRTSAEQCGRCRATVCHRTASPFISASIRRRCESISATNWIAGSVEATAKVAQTLFHLATVEKNVPAVIFWMKARAGWRETIKTENEHYDRDLQTASADEIARELAEIRARKRASAREGVVAAGVPAKLPGVLH